MKRTTRMSALLGAATALLLWGGAELAAPSAQAAPCPALQACSHLVPDGRFIVERAQLHGCNGASSHKHARSRRILTR